MNLSTDLAKVCARESSAAMNLAIRELSEQTKRLADNGSISLAVTRGYDGTVNVEFHAWQGADLFTADTLDAAIEGVKKKTMPTLMAQRKRAEAAKLLEEAKALDGVEK